MYPTVSDLISDLLGFNLPLPVQTFGFMLAVSFLLAAYTLQLELKRKEKSGLLNVLKVSRTVGLPASFSELFWSFVTGFVIGYKGVYALSNYSLFVEDTQSFILSLKGNVVGGLLLGTLMAYWNYREKEKQKLPSPKVVVEQVHPHQLVSSLTMVAAISGIIGAKLFHNLENLDDLVADPLDALLSFSGLTMYGGLIAGSLAVMYYGRRHGMHPLLLADATAPGLMLAYGTGRLGCQLSGDGDWGIVNLHPKPSALSWLPDWCWSYSYPNNVINEGVLIPGCEGRHCMMLPEPVFPTPLYEAVACIFLFAFLWWMRKRLINVGLLFSLYLLLNGIERLAIEQIRVNNRFHLLGLEVTQAEVIASLLIMAGGLGLWYFSFRPLKIRKQHHHA